ncbi:MAG: LapA family protein [Methylacidiphilales bacterium]|nr:LapA family protein [Candidatus Methylacidiphilales bacterium]NJR14255.1 LapA family protein [Calothrix sp. CSU_2_0]
MAVIRLILLVAVLGGLTLLLVQNFSPALPLVFLGVRSQPLPLAMWILLSVVAGGITELLISSLYELTNYFGGSSKQTRPQSTVSSSNRNSSYRQPENTSRSTSSPESREKSEYRSNAEDDWNLEDNEDWDFEQQQKPNYRPQEEPRDKQVSSNSKNYEREQQPIRSDKSGSSYSISYREPKNTGVGKTESVYDADYRVIVPPYQPPSPENSTPTQPSTSPAATSKANNESEDDDWSFFEEDEDEDFGDESRNSRK